MKKCPNCGRTWYYDVESCAYCKKPLVGIDSHEWIVKGVTQVNVPSAKHPRVPYNVLLLQDEHGNYSLKKSMATAKIGDHYEASGEATRIFKPVGVVGTGVMGSGIAAVALLGGARVVVLGRSQASLDKSKDAIVKVISRGVSQEDLKTFMENLLMTVNENDLKDCGVVVESIVENLEEKKKLFARLDKALSKSILATNTSSFSVDELASVTSNPSRVAGMHFFNPVTRMQLVEVVKGKKTSEDTVRALVDLSQALNKKPIIVKDSPAFVVNRVLMPFLNEAVITLEAGVASPSDIDEAVKLGLNHPMGPLALLDLIGLDVFIEIMDELYRRTKDPKFKAADLARRMLKEGKIGVKTKQGFYSY